MSDRDRKAEGEHSNDHERARDISIKEAEQILNRHVVGETFGPKDSEGELNQLVLDTISAICPSRGR
jgi:hypothetical protein